jgi:hypothetical protein
MNFDTAQLVIFFIAFWLGCVKIPATLPQAFNSQIPKSSATAAQLSP